MTSPNDDTRRSSRLSDVVSPLNLPRIRSPEKATAKQGRPFSEINLPFRRSSASLSNIFASTSAAAKRASTPSFGIKAPGTASPSLFAQDALAQGTDAADPCRSLIIRSFAPHIAVLPSSDTEDLLAEKGFGGGFLELIRPYGDNLQGKVTIRDSSGSSKSWDDYAVHFTRLRDGLESPRIQPGKEAEAKLRNINGIVDQYFPDSSPRLRTGGDIGFVEDTVERHLSYSELDNTEEIQDDEPQRSQFHALYLRKLLSGLPMSPHETFSHPTACVIVASSRNPDPIDEFRQLYAATNTGEQKLPPWANNEYLRYYVLVHDEEHDDVQRSTNLYDQMKRHFGLHCHLLRIRSTQCVASDDDCVRLPHCEWISAAEELAEIEKRETHEDVDDDPGPCLFESDAAAMRTFVRELVTQSVIPLMERQCATWNDQIASRRRGLSGRFMSLSKKMDALRLLLSFLQLDWLSHERRQLRLPPRRLPARHPRSPPPQARRLRLHAPRLQARREHLRPHPQRPLRRQSVEALRRRQRDDGHRLAALPANLPPKGKSDSVDALLEAACYSYATRCGDAFGALRTLAVASKLLHLRGEGFADDAARWALRILELDLVGAVGRAVFSEDVAACFAARRGVGSGKWGSRERKAALWRVLATEAWLGIDKTAQAEACLAEVFRLYKVKPATLERLGFEGMCAFLEDLKEAVTVRRGEAEEEERGGGGGGGRRHAEEMGPSGTPGLRMEEDNEEGEAHVGEKIDIRRHRKSLIGMQTSPLARDASPSRPAE